MSKISLLVLSLILLCSISNAKPKFVPDSVKKLADEFEALPPEEQARRKAEADAQYLEQFGKEALEIKKCVSHHGWRGDDTLTPEAIWIDKRLEQEGLIHLTRDRYLKYVYNQQSSPTPWLIMFAWTPYGNNNDAYQTTEMMMKKLYCAKKVYGDKLAVGFVDYGVDEFVKEAFDLDKRRLGQMAASLVFIKEGTVYHTKQHNHSPDVLANIINHQLNTTRQQSVPYPVNSVTIYWEYLKNDLIHDKRIKPYLTQIQQNYKDEQWYIDYCAWFFSNKVTDKTVGKRLVFYIFLPAILIALTGAYLTLKLFCLCICRCKHSKYQKVREQVASEQQNTKIKHQ